MKKGDDVAVYTDLKNQILKGTTKFNIEDYVYIGHGVANLSRSELFKIGIQSGVAVTMKNTISQCPRINDLVLEPLQSKYLMQNLPSILAVHQLEINPNDKCLDLCAAPGGKTTHIASLLNENNAVLAFDKSNSKIQQIQNMAARLEIPDARIKTEVQDSTKVDLKHESFDKILLDAPCSALGQRPLLIQSSRVKELKSFMRLQKKLFDKAVTFLKTNGILVYSTCTITLDENENLVKWALDKYENLIELCETYPKLGEPGYNLGLEAKKVQRFGPAGDQDSTIGFFIAKFRKVC